MDTDIPYSHLADIQRCPLSGRIVGKADIGDL
jgi:hypothetical protein